MPRGSLASPSLLTLPLSLAPDPHLPLTTPPSLLSPSSLISGPLLCIPSPTLASNPLPRGGHLLSREHGFVDGIPVHLRVVWGMWSCRMCVLARRLTAAIFRYASPFSCLQHTIPTMSFGENSAFIGRVGVWREVSTPISFLTLIIV